jgi:S1-C subfamily serine protease
MSLWTDDRTYEPPPPREPRKPAEPAAQQPPASPPPPPRQPSRWPAAFGGGLVSAVVVSAVLLGTGLAGDDTSSTTAPAASPAPTTPVVSNASDSRGDLVRKVYAAVSPSVVSVRTESGSGTGFLVKGDGTIVTNAHVVGDSSQVKVRFDDKGELVDAQVLSVDTSTDLAALKVESVPDGVQPLKLADSDQVQVGDTAVAIGYPLGLDRTATAGIVSGLERQISAPNGFSIDKVIQTDAAVNPGNSGGPLLNARGEVIGVNSQIATAGGGEGNVGIAFAIPVNTVKEVLPALESGNAPEHAYLGLQTSDTANGEGAEIAQATANGPAEKAGLQAGDVVVKVDGQDVTGANDVAAAIEDNKPGDKVQVTVRRGGSEQTIDVTLGQRPDSVQAQPTDPNQVP